MGVDDKLYKVGRKNRHVDHSKAPLVSSKEFKLGVTIQWLPFGQKRVCSECHAIILGKNKQPGGRWVRLFQDGTVRHYYGACR